MRRSSRLFRMIGAAALLISMLAAITPVAAQQDSPGGPTMDYPFQNAPPAFSWGSNVIFYPWVANDDNFGLGDADTSISVQNLQDQDGQIWIYVGNGDNTWSLATTAALSAYASKTFTAQMLGIDPGEGAPVAVRGYTHGTTTIQQPVIETQILLSNPVAGAPVDQGASPGPGGDWTQVFVCVVNIHAGGAVSGEPYPFTLAIPTLTWDGVTYNQGDAVPWDTQAELQEILEIANEDNDGPMINPFGGINQDGDCLDATTVPETGAATLWNSLTIGGVAKMAVEGESLPYTTTADTAVSGYNALNGLEVDRFNEWYLPIVQTNCGPGGCWDSMLRVANLTNFNSAITIRFFPADDGSGSLHTGFQVQALVNGGDTWHVNLGDLVPDGWVGSAHIYSDGQIFAMVDRYKVGYSMWISNTGSAADFENVAQVPNANGRYALFAPSVMMDYFGWNTGINVANLHNGDNNISIQYFNMLGNATQVLSQRLAAHGMTYFYDPSQGPQNNSAQDVLSDPNAGVVGSAIIWSDHPVAAAVDATKYPESDPRGGPDLFQATSYNATQNIYTWQAVPLVQKGNPADGMGATSGINIMNPNPTAATVHAYFVNPSGFNAQNFGISSVTIPGFANGFIYLMAQHNVPNGFVGAAQVISNIPVAAVSANVDYQVDGDGSAIFNAFNSCGLYRTPDVPNSPWECFFGDPFDVTGRSFTKFFVDDSDDANPVPGVNFHIVNDNPDFPYQRNGVSGPDGSAIFTNIPVGNYELHIDSLPVGFTTESGELGWQEDFEMNQGQDVELTNTLIRLQYEFTKTVVLEGTLGVPLEGINVVIYEWTGDTIGGVPVVTNLGDPNIDTTTDEDGQVTVDLYPGQYVLCMYDADATATYVHPVTLDEVTVFPDLQASADLSTADCETFVMPFADHELENEVGLLFVTKTVLDTDGEPVEGAVVTIVDIDGAIEIDLSETTGEDGTATFNVPAGTYLLCSTVEMDDGLGGTFDFTICEEIEVVAGQVNEEENNHLTGSLVKYVCDETNTLEDGCQEDQNEIQEITPFLPQAFINCGDFSITFGDPPNNSAFLGSNCDATPAEIEAAMIAQIDALVAGDIIVTGGPLYGAPGTTAPVFVEFSGNYALQDVPLLQVVASGTSGGGDVSTIQEAAVSAVVPGATVQVFEALPGSDLGDDTTWGPEVTNGPQLTDADGRFEIPVLPEGTYILCTDAPTAVSQECEFFEISEGAETFIVNDIDILGSMDVVNEAQNEIQTLTNLIPQNATFTITLFTETTNAIGGQASGEFGIQPELQGLPSVGANNVSCFGTLQFGNTVTCEFVGTLAGIDIPEMVTTDTPPTDIEVITVQEGGVSATISADALVSGGTFTLTFNSETTAPIAWDASAADIQAALEALATIGVGDVNVSGGDLPGADVLVLFTGTLAGTSENLTIDDSNIT